MNYPVFATAPAAPSSRSSSRADTSRVGGGCPITRYTAPQDLPFIIGVKDAAAWLGIHHDTMRGHAIKGKVPCLWIGGKLCFRKDQLLASMERGGKTTLKK